jgi:hypothetical protein
MTQPEKHHHNKTRIPITMLIKINTTETLIKDFREDSGQTPSSKLTINKPIADPTHRRGTIPRIPSNSKMQDSPVGETGTNGFTSSTGSSSKNS